MPMVMSMNVILIVLDTCTANHLSCYGYNRKTSQNADSLAKKGTLFTNDYATDVPTIPSFTALFSGKRGIKTSVVSFNQNEVLPEDLTWLPRTIAKQGYLTAAVSTLFNMRKWFALGYHYYMDPLGSNTARTQTVEAEEINSMAVQWIKQNYKRNFFLFVHYWDPHVESVWGGKAPIPRYKVPEGYKNPYYRGETSDPSDREYLISQYDANINYADKYIGEILQTLDGVGITEKTAIIFTSDHGEDLGEEHPGVASAKFGQEPLLKGVWDHPDAFEPVIRVPLIIKTPEKSAVKKVEALVQSVDVSATILDLLGIGLPPDLDGRSLLPLMRGEVKEWYPEVYSNQGLWTVKRVIVTKEGMKLIKTLDKGQWKDAPDIELYDLKKDPSETRNLAEEDKETANELELRMERWLWKSLGGRLDPLAIRAGLGYVRGKLVPYYGYIHARLGT